MTNQSKHEFDQYKDHYGANIDDSIAFAGQEHDFYLKLKADHLNNLIDKSFESDDVVNILDIGCGHGLLHKHLDKPRYNIKACDPAASVIEEARRMNPHVAYVSNDGHTLPYDDESVDVAFTVCVMHHVPPEKWQSFLKEMKRVIRPGGLLVVYEHNPYNPLTLYIVKTCPLDANAVLLRSSRLKKLLHSCQIQNVRQEYIIFFPFRGEFFRFLERFLCWLPLGAQYNICARIKG